jgi:cystathionine beta-lyase
MGDERAKGFSAETKTVHAGRARGADHGALNAPVVRASTFAQPSLDAWEAITKPGAPGYRYGFFATPTTDAFEAAIAELYGADKAIAVSSGLAAATAALTALTGHGDHVLAPDSTYLATRRFCNQVLGRYGVETTYYDPLIGAGISELMRPNTRVVLAESPGSLTFEVQDVPAIAAAAHARGAKVILDNTWATALRFDPFAHGVDVVVEAITSYIGGHGDLLLGAIVANGTLGVRLHGVAKTLGHSTSGDDCFLALRGLKSLAVRLAKSEESALALAHWLKTVPEVARVLHPALPDHPGHAIFTRDFRGGSGLFSIVLREAPRAAVAAFVDGLRVFGIGYSYGGADSLIMPGDPRLVRSVTPWNEPGQLLRIYAGLEAFEDLKADLDAGLARFREALR